MHTFNHVKRTLAHAARDVGDTLADAAQSARDAVVDAKDAVVDAAKDARDKTLDVAADAKQAVTKLADDMTCAILGDAKDDILDKLKTDHETVAGFFAQLEATSNTARALRADLFAQLKYELEAHSQAEEKTFYVALRGDSADLAEAHTDHELVQQLLDDLADQPVGTEAWLGQLRVLKENVERHVQMEEDVLFTDARTRLTSATREDLGLRFQSLKEYGRGTDRGARGRTAQRRGSIKTKGTSRKQLRGHHEAAHR